MNNRARGGSDLGGGRKSGAGMVTGRRRDGECLMAQTQSFPVQTANGRVEGRKSQDVDGVAVDIWGPTDGDEANISTGTEGGSMELSIVAGSGDLGTVATTSIRGGARAPEDWGDLAFFY
ncbi:hypothetical protein DPX16_8898 [Anabarilius grahami]|uniref:Uncharacterized protein n=1 Tax=Anabarilius grahami TaxID=495550 RepID=A0A3N0YDE4_ANAGA|nr:hypothetical protein DPX16_8898 [Anabarilius grahami]